MGQKLKKINIKIDINEYTDRYIRIYIKKNFMNERIGKNICTYYTKMERQMKDLQKESQKDRKIERSKVRKLERLKFRNIQKDRKVERQKDRKLERKKD